MAKRRKKARRDSRKVTCVAGTTCHLVILLLAAEKLGLLAS